MVESGSGVVVSVTKGAGTGFGAIGAVVCYFRDFGSLGFAALVRLGVKMGFASVNFEVSGLWIGEICNFEVGILVGGGNRFSLLDLDLSLFLNSNLVWKDRLSPVTELLV